MCIVRRRHVGQCLVGAVDGDERVPHRWLLDRRMQRVRELLETTDLPVARIARTGFGSVETLRHHFTRHVGTTPRAYQDDFPGIREVGLSGNFGAPPDDLSCGWRCGVARVHGQPQPVRHRPGPEHERMNELIMTTPALRDYSRKLWIRCEAPLAEVIAAESAETTSPPAPSLATSWRSVNAVLDVTVDSDEQLGDPHRQTRVNEHR